MIKDWFRPCPNKARSVNFASLKIYHCRIGYYINIINIVSLRFHENCAVSLDAFSRGVVILIFISEVVDVKR